MQVVLLRVGIDSASGGMQGPLFEDGSFELVPIPDNFKHSIKNSETYGTTRSPSGRSLLDYFPAKMQEKCCDQCIHADPEFDTFTYGDPTKGAKRGLRRLQQGDLLVFYAGLEPWPEGGAQQLYIVGYFSVAWAGIATELGEVELSAKFRRNFHVKHRDVFEDQKERLVLVKGDETSRLLKKAVLISATGADKSGQPLKILSKQMQATFGDFDGRISIQRCAPRWVDEIYVAKAATFVRSLV